MTPLHAFLSWVSVKLSPGCFTASSSIQIHIYFPRLLPGTSSLQPNSSLILQPAASGEHRRAAPNHGVGNAALTRTSSALCRSLAKHRQAGETRSEKSALLARPKETRFPHFPTERSVVKGRGERLRRGDTTKDPSSRCCHREGPAGSENLFKAWLRHFLREIRHLAQLIHYPLQLLVALSRARH